MKGKHISRNAQRKMQSVPNMQEMSMDQLMKIVDKAQSLISEKGYEAAFRQHREIVEQGQRASLQIHSLCHFATR